jgi:hypothetical protein
VQFRDVRDGGRTITGPTAIDVLQSRDYKQRGGFADSSTRKLGGFGATKDIPDADVHHWW